MSLRSKVVIFSLLTMAVFVAVLYSGTAYVLLGGFAQVEQRYVGNQVSLIERTLAAEQDALKANVISWSAWNGMYDFATTPNPAFARTELGASALSSMDLDFFIILRPDGKIILSRLLGSLAGEKLLPEDMRAYLKPSNPMLHHVTMHDAHTEITALSAGPVMVALAPIVTSTFQGPVKGSLIMGRFLNTPRLRELRQVTGLKFSLHPINALVSERAETLRIQLNQTPADTITVREQDFKSILGYARLQDSTGKDVLLLEVETSRPIYAQAVRSRAALLEVVVATGIIFVLLTIYLLHRFALARLAALNRGVQAVSREGSAAKRLELHGNDEFAKLAASTNEMLAILETAQREVSENQARYALVVQSVNDGIWDWNLTTDETYYSARWKTMLGYPESAVINSADVAQSHIHPDDRVRTRANVIAHLKGETSFLETEVRMRILDGSYRWMLLRGAASHDEAGRAVRMAGSLTDLTRRGVFDALTGLPNRLLLREKLEYTLSKARKNSTCQSALLFMDLNRFKVVNDSLGHHVGDLLITEIAKRLQSGVRSGDTVARLGGDEFVVLLDDLGGEDDLAKAVERISNTTTTTVTLAGQQLSTSMSIGVVADLSAYGNTNDALRDADNAMYQAKIARKPFAYFDQRMLEQVKKRLELEADLRHAIKNGELSIVHQPVILLREAKMSGVESLVRWHHPTRGVIAPSEFIPIAEEAGLIGALGEWVLRRACREISCLGSSFALGVNLSSKQFDDTLVDRVASILKETALPPHRLILEVTESAVVKDPVLAAGLLAQLRALGVRIALDDFGTGYSSLSYLSSLPLDILKIDRTFVGRLMVDAQSVAIVRTIISLAQTLGLSVVAEGVETQAQADLLKSLGCPYGQGYYFSTPMPLESLAELSKGSLSREGASAHAHPAN